MLRDAKMVVYCEYNHNCSSNVGCVKMKKVGRAGFMYIYPIIVNHFKLRQKINKLVDLERDD